MKKVLFSLLLSSLFVISPSFALGYTLLPQTGAVPIAGNYTFSVPKNSTFTVLAGIGNVRYVRFSADGYASYTMSVTNGEFHYQNGYVNGDYNSDSGNQYPTDGFRIVGHFNNSTSASGVINYVYNGSIVSTYNFTAKNTEHNPFGYVDGVTNGVLNGWAVDSDTPTISIPVDIYIDGQVGSGGTLIARVYANKSSPDITSLYPGFTGNHRFSYTIPAKYNDGKSHKIYVYGINSGQGSNALLAGSPKSFASAVNRVPVGYFDVIVGQECGFSPGVCAIVTSAKGWAVDPDVPSTSIRVAGYIDGAYGAGGTYLGTITANTPRPDITTIYPTYTGEHGFRFIIPETYRDGRPHTMYIYAIDSAGGVNSLLPGSPKTFVFQ